MLQSWSELVRSRSELGSGLGGAHRAWGLLEGWEEQEEGRQAQGEQEAGPGQMGRGCLHPDG